MKHPPQNILDRLIAEAQADDYALAQRSGPTTRGNPFIAGLLFALIGLLLATAFWQRQSVQPAAEQRREALVERIRTQTDRAEDAQDQAAQLRASVSSCNNSPPMAWGRTSARNCGPSRSRRGSWGCGDRGPSS